MILRNPTSSRISKAFHPLPTIPLVVHGESRPMVGGEGPGDLGSGSVESLLRERK